MVCAANNCTTCLCGFMKHNCDVNCYLNNCNRVCAGITHVRERIGHRIASLNFHRSDTDLSSLGAPPPRPNPMSIVLAFAMRT